MTNLTDRVGRSGIDNYTVSSFICDMQISQNQNTLSAPSEEVPPDSGVDTDNVDAKRTEIGSRDLKQVRGEALD